MTAEDRRCDTQPAVSCQTENTLVITEQILSYSIVGIPGSFFSPTHTISAQQPRGKKMDKYAEGGRLHVYILSGSVSNALAAS